MSADGNQEDRDSAAELAPGRLRRTRESRSGKLVDVSIDEIVTELAQRIGEESGWFSEIDADLVSELHYRIGESIEVHENRFSRRRYGDLFAIYYEDLGSKKPALDGATFLELGCGGLNPAGLMFVFVALGLSRGIVVDLDPVEDSPRAVKALADVVACLLVDPSRILRERDISPEQVLRNLASFDLRAMGRGDSEGIDSSRLSHAIESASDLSLEDESVDYIFSNSFFEHLSDPVSVIEEAYRVLRPDSLMVHGIDFIDHEHYANSQIHPLNFLTIESSEVLVNSSNRLRLSQIKRLFERHGFSILTTEITESVPVDDALRSNFVGPYSSMSNDDLSVLTAKITMRRKA